MRKARDRQTVQATAVAREFTAATRALGPAVKSYECAAKLCMPVFFCAAAQHNCPLVYVHASALQRQPQGTTCAGLTTAS
jgi:hypothetical protein